jgi:hypothetical protein
VPAGGGVIVDVAGAPSCNRVAVTATDGGNQYPFESTGSISVDGGELCQFQGLSGHPGTFTVQALVDGAPAGSQVVTLEKIDDCNVSAQLVRFDVSVP